MSTLRIRFSQKPSTVKGAQSRQTQRLLAWKKLKKLLFLGSAQIPFVSIAEIELGVELSSTMLTKRAP